MKIFASLLLICCWVNSPGQTNSAPGAGESNSLPLAQTQSPTGEPEKPLLATTTNTWDELKLEMPLSLSILADDLAGDISAPSIGATSDPLALNSNERVMLKYYERLERGGYLTRPPLPSENLYVRGLNAIFQPEAFRVGKTQVAFSPITAIKRKNPLALLNPIVLSVSW